MITAFTYLIFLSILVKMQHNRSIFSWNSQGCANSKFPRIFREYSMDFKPDFVSLLETKTSGKKADEVIASLGFHSSFRVEAHGFSGGKWLGWKDSVQLEVIHNHPQFILTQLRYGIPVQKIFICFVYGSPNKSKRAGLWKALANTIPTTLVPWMAVGEFNALLSMDDKKGGNHVGQRCPLFGKFLNDKNLHDLGFLGPPFTWQRGRTFERLDRVQILIFLKVGLLGFW